METEIAKIIIKDKDGKLLESFYVRRHVFDAMEKILKYTKKDLKIEVSFIKLF